MTVLEVLTAATGYLEKHEVESPRLNAEHLLAHVLGRKRLDLYLEFDRPLSDAQRAPLRDLIRERGAGRPLQHLMGTAEFFGHSFLCDSRALIPRPETEQLVELALARNPAPTRFLDVGTGSGVIAITLALALPQSSPVALDISSLALSLARENAIRHSVDQRLILQEADLLPAKTEPFDLIVANLPYVSSEEMSSLQREVRFDPVSALDGGLDGLVLVEKLIANAAPHMTPGGVVVLEIGHDQAARVASLFEKHGYREIVIATDFQRIERFVSARRAK